MINKYHESKFWIEWEYKKKVTLIFFESKLCIVLIS